ncbi:unnamed protein product [Effrenium voratum]|nr:unnamed protein product [Effrenium voratum]
MGSQGTADNNFWLWGTWGKRVIKAPFLTQKVPGKIRDIVIGQNFIIALKEDGHLVSWGEDKVGCLGLGTEQVNVQDPKKVIFPSGFEGKIVDVQYGKHHVLALTSTGKLYAWGDNSRGQLGLSDQQNRYEPVAVEELRPYTVTQVLALENMSYALTSHGKVYAWGDNTDGCLALEHDKAVVDKPEPMMRMKETEVKKLVVRDCGGAGGKGKTVIAFVELADPLSQKDTIGGFDRPLGGSETDAVVLSDDMEKDIFEGVDLMRQVMDNTQDWWEHILKVRHGSPYTDNPLQVDDLADKDLDNCSAMQLDTFVGLEVLEDASYELDKFIQSARAQLFEIRKKKGTKNVKFMLSLFMDDCKLRREKIRRTVAARQLIEYKRGMPTGAPDLLGIGPDRANYLSKETEAVSSQLTKVRNLRTYDLFTRVLQESLSEVLESKLQVLGLQEEVLKMKQGQKMDISLPGLKILMGRWADLKRFSIYNLYQECNLRGQGLAFNSDDEMFSFLVASSDAKIDQIISMDRDLLVSRDSHIPGLCYELLVENAELRKMCNAYQLKDKSFYASDCVSRRIVRLPRWSKVERPLGRLAGRLGGGVAGGGGNVTSFAFPNAPWAFHLLACAAGVGFVRPCVTLHCQAACGQDMDALTRLSKHCGAARTCADVCSFVLPAVLYDLTSWAGVAAFGAVLALLYLALALPLHTSGWADVQEEAPNKKPIRWIDWVLSGAFVSTEMQWNMLNTAVPATLVGNYAFPTYAVGAALGSGALVAMCYLLALPSLRCLNPPRPTNLLLSYAFMSGSWLLMLAALLGPSPFFLLGLWLFLAMANASQVVLMECLTGVNDPEASSQIMGFSEMLGCGVGMAGSFAGEWLMSWSTLAPFACCGCGSLCCSLILALALGHRKMQRSGGAAVSRDCCTELRPLAGSVQGLSMILADRDHSFIGPEMEFRAMPPSLQPRVRELQSP